MAERTTEDRLTDLETLVVSMLDLVVLDMAEDQTLARLNPIGRERLESLIALRAEIGRDLAERGVTVDTASL